MRATGVPHPRTLKDARGHLRGAQSLSSVDGSQVHDTGDPLRFWGRAPWAIQLPEFLENVKCPDSTGGGVFVHTSNLLVFFHDDECELITIQFVMAYL